MTDTMKSDNITAIATKRPRCYLVYALAPKGTKARAANDAINAMTADATLPLALWHDHFIKEAGGCIIFYVANQEKQQALFQSQHLAGWQVDFRPLIFSFSPSAFDAQTSFTLKNYRHSDWESLRQQERPDYGARNVAQEAETAEEALTDLTPET